MLNAQTRISNSLGLQPAEVHLPQIDKAYAKFALLGQVPVWLRLTFENLLALAVGEVFDGSSVAVFQDSYFYRAARGVAITMN